MTWEKLQNLILEKPKDQPLSFFWGVWARRITGLITFLAALSILIDTLYKAQSYKIVPILGATFLAGIHLLYLQVVLGLLVFSYPPERQHYQKLYYPFLLGGAYITHAMSGLTEEIFSSFDFLLTIDIDIRGNFRNWSQTAAYVLFFVLYALWICRDILERRATGNSKRKMEHLAWIFIEVFILLGLGFVLFHKLGWGVFDRQWQAWFDSDKLPYGILPNKLFLGPKDLIIATCVIAVPVVRRIVKQMRVYKDQYRAYLKYNEATITEGVIAGLIGGKNIKTILDFGCGNGFRLAENLKLLGLWNSANSFEIVGFDRDEDWEGPFKNEFDKINEVEFWGKPDINRLKTFKADLIILSHVLYEPKTVKEIEKLLKRQDEGTLVLIRGASARSFFHVASLENSLKILFPTAAHLWETNSLAELVGKVGLEPVPYNEKPYYLLPQRYKLDPHGEAAENAGNLIDYLYGSEAGKRIQDFFNQLAKIKPESSEISVVNDDAIYMYKRHGPVAQ